MARSLRQALQDCSRKRRWQQAVHLFDSEASNDQVAVNCVIGACAAARQWQQALALASRADAFGAAALLKAVGGRWHLALHVLRQVRAPDVCLFNVAMSTMRRATQWVWALQLLRHLQEAPKLIPDLISFNTAVGACALGTAWQRGLALFARMPCRPDAVTYSSLTAPWPVQLALLWQALKEVQPDTVLFGSAISTLSRSSQWQRALLLFSEMETRRLQPNAITLSAGIGACERGSLWQASGRKGVRGHWLLGASAIILRLYTNPEFDIKAKYAQLLTTTFVTLTYSSGLPLLYLLGFGYTALMYWADKISLLWYSKRPPQYDALLAKESSEAMLYACALHCIFAVLMFGQPCVFPTRQVGGDLGALLQQNGGDASSALGINTGISERLTQETTWMFVAFFALLLALWVFWWLKVIFAETFGTAASMCWSLCCAAPKPKEEIITTPAASDAGLDGTLRSVTSKTSKSSKKDVDVAESMTWKEAEEIIERVAPPACYHWWRHPDQAEIAHHMKAQVSRKTRSNAPDLPVPQPAGQSFGKAMDG
ncbi:unnamed protein product [Effrenium voratum]|nr:unnamed protein product [Effrenium voratum]